MKKSFIPKLLLCLLTALALTGCETLSNKGKIDYGAAKTLPPLEVPPDLTAPPPGTDSMAKTAPTPGATTYSEFSAEQKTPSAAPADTSVLPQFPDIKVSREGNIRWLAVKATPDALWPKVREFVLSRGLLITKENPQIGLIETDWAENRAKVGTGAQKVLAKWLSSLYSTGTRDRYRFRLERGTDPGTTDIYVTQQGMEEVAMEDKTGTESKGTIWQPRPTDPELEAEMMRLLMVYLGTSEDQAKTQIAASSVPAPERAKLVKGDAGDVLTLQDDPERAWRRVGLSLDRLGFTVEDRDRSKGIYYVRYLDPDKEGKAGGWFSGWFSKDQPKPKDQYQIHIKGADTGTRVEVLDKNGVPDTSETRDRILSLLYEQLK